MSDTVLFSEREPLIIKEHTAIIQSLGRSATSTGPDGEKHDVYLTPEPYEQSLDAWNGKIIIYGQEHPNLDAWEKDPVAELTRIRGRKIGVVKNARMDKTGHKKILAELPISDAEVEALMAAGTLGLSTGFRCDIEDGRIKSYVRPHHVLLFPETQGAVPGDKGTWFLNQDRDFGFSELDADALAREWDALAKEYEKV